jgi:hypothetical protein
MVKGSLKGKGLRDPFTINQKPSIHLSKESFHLYNFNLSHLPLAFSPSPLTKLLVVEPDYLPDSDVPFQQFLDPIP